MRFQAPPEDPAQLAEDVRRIMAREEFRYEPSWFDRLSEWIGRQLERLFGGAEPTGGAPAASFAGGIGPVLAWVLILVAVAAVVVVVVYVVRHRVRRPDSDEGPGTEIEVEHRRRAREWARDAERLEAEGDWKGALRARYRELVRTLVDRGQVPDIAGRTTGELRQDLAESTPGAAEAFDRASLLFELAWYAHVPTGPEQAGQFREAAATVLAATPQSRVGDGDGDGATGGGDVVEVRA